MRTKNGCVFCDKIILADGIRYEYGHAGATSIVSFEPLNPVVPGHRLFVPVQHFEKDTRRLDELGLVFSLAHRHGQTQDIDFNLIQSNGPGATQTVDHLHVHYVPRDSKDGLLLPWSTQESPARIDRSVSDAGQVGGD